MSAGESHLTVGAFGIVVGKASVSWSVRWARWREATTAATYLLLTNYLLLLLLLMMIIALTYCWPTLCQISLHVSSNLSLITIPKARLPVSKMSFREMLFNQCFHLWLCSSSRRGTIHVVQVRNCVFITVSQEIAVKYHKEVHSFHLYKGNI